MLYPLSYGDGYIAVMELTDLLNRTRDVMTQKIADRMHRIGRDSDLEEVVADLIRALEIVADTQRLLIRTEVEKLQLGPYDALIVKLGDRESGWIPGPDQEAYAKQLFDQLAKELGWKGPILVYHYGVELEVIQRDLAKR